MLGYNKWWLRCLVELLLREPSLLEHLVPGPLERLLCVPKVVGLLLVLRLVIDRPEEVEDDHQQHAHKPPAATDGR